MLSFAIKKPFNVQCLPNTQVQILKLDNKRMDL